MITQFCSDNCATKAYKKRKREEKMKSLFSKKAEKAMYDPAISQKEFLSIDEACQLINASRGRSSD